MALTSASLGPEEESLRWTWWEFGVGVLLGCLNRSPNENHCRPAMAMEQTFVVDARDDERGKKERGCKTRLHRPLSERDTQGPAYITCPFGRVSRPVSQVPHAHVLWNFLDETSSLSDFREGRYIH